MSGSLSITVGVLFVVMLFNLLVYYPFYLNYFFNYWIIEEEKIIYNNSKSYAESIKRFFNGLIGKEKTTEKILKYEEIKEINIIYEKKGFNPNNAFALGIYAPTFFLPYLREQFYLQVLTEDNEKIKLDLTVDYYKNHRSAYILLKEICEFFASKNIKVNDPQNLIEASISKLHVSKYIWRN